jgi:CMP-N,N'-diacetyllegionaminic acid synthase
LKILHLITARAGSKGLPGKNTKNLEGNPLFMYSVEFAKNNMNDIDELCISTNDDELISMAKSRGIDVPFKRPEDLASDSATSNDVIRHAVNYYKAQGKEFDAVLLLQPTSPIRLDSDYRSIIDTYSADIDMVVSVKESKENPYFTLYEEDDKGLLEKSKKGEFSRRQDCPSVFAFNGSMYLINVRTIMSKDLSHFTNIKKLVMPDERSVDIDTMADWTLAEYYMNNALKR